MPKKLLSDKDRKKRSQSPTPNKTKDSDKRKNGSKRPKLTLQNSKDMKKKDQLDKARNSNSVPIKKRLANLKQKMVCKKMQDVSPSKKTRSKTLIQSSKRLDKTSEKTRKKSSTPGASSSRHRKSMNLQSNIFVKQELSPSSETRAADFAHGFALFVAKEEDVIIEENEEIDDIFVYENNINPYDNGKKGKKSKKKTARLAQMCPDNLAAEFDSFRNLDGKYSPQFIYSLERINLPYSKPHSKYLKEARAILDSTLFKYGSDRAYFDSFGAVVTQETTERVFQNYINSLNVADLLTFEFKEHTIAQTKTVFLDKGKAKVVIGLPVLYRQKLLLSVLNHEVGTHFLRKLNDLNQQWNGNRLKFKLKNHLVTEEGLASINQVIEDAKDPNGTPLLYSAALHYYAAYLASVMSFEEMHSVLKKYISDEIKLWRECVRVKRGMRDTSRKGGMFKDQVYLRGAIEIIKHRNEIDFVALFSGKIGLSDYFRLQKHDQIEHRGLVLPYFLHDIDSYKAALNKIAEVNMIN